MFFIKTPIQFVRFSKLWLLSALCLLLSACTEPQTLTHLDRIKQKGALTLVTRPGPATFQSDVNVLSGFEYELAQSFADYLQVELYIINQENLNDLFRTLNSGEADFAAAGLSILSSRKDTIRFGPSYQEISSKLVFKQGKKWPRSFAQLDGELRVLANSSHAEQLLQEKEKYSNLSWKETANHSTLDLVKMVLSEKIDYTMVDSNELSLLRRYHPELAIAFTVGNTEQLAWGFRKNEDDSLYLEAIKFFGQQHLSGAIAQLQEKYYGHIQEFDYVDTKRFMSAVNKRFPRYKPYFLEAAADTMDWRLLAAISYQESHWNPRARSPTGVRGMMMLTLPTAKQVGVTSRLDAYQSIIGGAKYLKITHDRMPDRIAEPDRTWLALAAYNVGFGHLEDARILTERGGDNPDLWADVKEYLPLLRQRKYYKKTRHGFARGEEPVRYVTNIRRYYETLVWLDEQQQLQKRKQLAQEQQNQQEQTESPVVVSDSSN